MSNKRRQTFHVDREVQGALARRLITQWTLFLIVAMVLSLALRWMSDPFAPLGQTLRDAWWTYGPLLLTLGCLAPIFIYDAIKLSHRFIGPVHRLRQVTRSLAEGETPGPVEFRGADFWKDLADDFNRVVQRLSLSEAERDRQPE